MKSFMGQICKSSRLDQKKPTRLSVDNLVQLFVMQRQNFHPADPTGVLWPFLQQTHVIRDELMETK